MPLYMCYSIHVASKNRSFVPQLVSDYAQKQELRMERAGEVKHNQ
jgi:hypothetical protein